MSNPLDKHLQNAFADFEGLHISGTIPIREEILNELIAHVLQHGVPQPTPPAAVSAPPLDAGLNTPAGLNAPEVPAEPRVKPDVNALLQRVKRAGVRFENGRAVVDFEIGV